MFQRCYLQREVGGGGGQSKALILVFFLVALSHLAIVWNTGDLKEERIRVSKTRCFFSEPNPKIFLLPLCSVHLLFTLIMIIQSWKAFLESQLIRKQWYICRLPLLQLLVERHLWFALRYSLLLRVERLYPRLTILLRK